MTPEHLARSLLASPPHAEAKRLCDVVDAHAGNATYMAALGRALEVGVAAGRLSRRYREGGHS